MKLTHAYLIAALVIHGGCGDNSMKGSPYQSRTFGPPVVLQLNSYYYEGIRFAFHGGSDRLSVITLVPNDDGIGPFVLLGEDDVIDISSFSLDDFKLRRKGSEGLQSEQVPGEETVYPMIGRCDFSKEEKLVVTRYLAHEIPRSGGPEIAVTMKSPRLQIRRDLTPAKIKAQLGDPTKIISAKDQQ